MSWLTMWVYLGRESALDSKWDLFKAGWLVIWTFASLSVAHRCLWILFGKDVVTLHANEFQIAAADSGCWLSSPIPEL